MAGDALPRSRRLRRSADFRVIQRGGQRFRTRHLVVCYRSSPDGACRVGLTVSRKVGNAVVRNRVKRWLRESYRRQAADLRGVEIVLIARPSAANAGYAVLQRELFSAINRVTGTP